MLPKDKLPVIPDWSTLFSPDKVAHFGAYGLFVLLLSAAFTKRRKKWAILQAVLSATLFGVVMEILQGVIGTGRSFDPVDMVANFLGAILGGIVYFAYQQLKTSCGLNVP